MKNWQTKEQLKELLYRLVEIPSVTGSEAEITIAELIHNQLAELQYYEKNPHHLALHPTKDGRKLVTALVKTSSKKETIILLGHFDVVDVEDYGEYKNLAFRPKELTDVFYKNKTALPVPVQKDMEQGEWIFGRGSMDMKAGVTLNMSMVEKACDGRFDGNVLLLAVPDEEVNSLGMITATDVLLEIAKKHDLEYVTCLNTEPVFTRYPGDLNQYIYSGSIGKVLPGFLCYGMETHVGEPLAGVNANLMTSIVSKYMELNTDFCECVEGERTPPPTSLMQKDLKDSYSVQTPIAAAALFNLLTMEKPLQQITEELVSVAKKAATEIENHIHLQSAKYAEWVHFEPLKAHVSVLTYTELREKAITRFGKTEIESLEQRALANYQELGDRDLSTRVVYALANLCKDMGPMIVLFYSPPYYPAVSSRNNEKIMSVISKIMETAKNDFHVALEHQHYFSGLSDLSYTSLNQSEESLLSLTENMPLYNKSYDFPMDALRELNVPAMNLGPLGRDPHRWTERLNVDYSFGPLKELLEKTIDELLK